jgi:hypothetical protein
MYIYINIYVYIYIFTLVYGKEGGEVESLERTYSNIYVYIYIHLRGGELESPEKNDSKI